MIREIFVSFFLIVGTFFMLAGAVGILRFPDIYTRLHALSKSATLGMIGLLTASVISLWSVPVGIKYFLMVLFHFITNPVGAHMIARAAYYHLKVGFWDRTKSQDWGDRLP